MADAKTKAATGTAGKDPASKEAVKTAIRAPLFKVETVHRRARHLKLLIYGNYGTGKTYLAGTASTVEGMQDVLFINAEAGDLSLDEFEGLDSITITNFKMLGRIHEFLRQHCTARDAGNIERLRELEAVVRGVDIEDIKEPKQYRTVVLDSLTEIEAFCMNQILGVTDTTKIDDEIDGAEWGEFKKNNGMIQRLIRSFRDLPMHIIFICSEQFRQDETKKNKYSPDMTGKLSKKIQGFMDMVGYYAIGRDDKGKISRRLYVMPPASGKYDAKHRYSAFKGEFFDNPTIGAILEEVGLTDQVGVDLK